MYRIVLYWAYSFLIEILHNDMLQSMEDKGEMDIISAVKKFSVLRGETIMETTTTVNITAALTEYYLYARNYNELFKYSFSFHSLNSVYYYSHSIDDKIETLRGQGSQG